jgi:hypothetical protein
MGWVFAGGDYVQCDDFEKNFKTEFKVLKATGIWCSSLLVSPIRMAQK